MKIRARNLIPTTMVRSRGGNTFSLLRPFGLLLFAIAVLAVADLRANDRDESSVSCIGSVQLSLPQSGMVALSPQMFLAGTYDYDDFEVDINGPLTDVVSCSEIGQVLMVTVREIATGNSCWSTLEVEDKSGPDMDCDDVIVPCNMDISDEPFDFFIDVSDNCTPTEDLNIWFQETFMDLDCDPDFVASIKRTWYATDAFGNESSCMQTIYFERLDVNDTEFPMDTTISCVNADTSPENLGMPTIDGEVLDPFCEIIAWSSDQEIPLPCGGSFKIMRSWTVMDWCTGVTLPGLQTITVIDTVPPEITCPPDMTVGTESDVCSASFTIPAASATDICSDDNLIDIDVEVDGILGHSIGDMVDLDLGMHTIIYHATDDCGNMNSCSITVTVVDNQPPVAICSGSVVQIPLGPGDTTVVAAVDFQFTYIDNCGLVDTMIRRMDDACMHPEDLMFGDSVTLCCADVVGTIMLEIQVTDEAGNSATCMFEVDVKDPEPPEITCRDITIFLDDMGNVSIEADTLALTASDNCGIQGFSAEQTDFDCTDVGQQSIEVTVTDLDGNTATCDAEVTVLDTIPPMAICQDITVQLDDMGNITIEAADIDNGSSDACGIDTMTLDMTDFDCTDIGTNVVILTVTDANGLTSTCSATVTIEDDTPPECMAQDITVSLGDDDMVMITADQVDDGSFDVCSDVTVSVEPDLFDCSTAGDNVVTLTVTDASGNTSTCTATVTVEDMTAPVCVAQDITVTLDENGMATIDGADVDGGSSDACGNMLDFDVMPADFDCDDLGIVDVTLTVTDDSGNMATCTAQVTVTDTIAPVCMAMDITITLDENGEGMITPQDIDDGSFDLCGSIDMLTLSQDDFFCNDNGDNEVVLTVTDNSGNSSSCTATVTVVDTIAPICDADDITIFLDENGMVTLYPDDLNANSIDPCGNIVDFDANPVDFTCADLGSNMVTLTVFDNNGNSSSCVGMVTVADTLAPTCEIMDLTVDLDPMGNASITGADIDAGSTDNCTVISIVSTPSDFDCSDIGANAVLVVATDQSGNTSTCTAIVTVNDTINPNIVCPMDVTLACTDEITDLTMFGMPVAMDECGVSSVTEDTLDNRNACGIGFIIRTFTVEDLDGNESVCQQFIDINGPQNPLMESDITWPPGVVDITVNCTSIEPENLPNGVPIVNTDNVDCSLISIDFEDSDPIGDCVCDGSITRTWTVIDSCTLDEFMGDGIFMFVQTINILDTEPPVLSGPMDVTVFADADTCDVFVNLAAVTAEDCNENVVIVNDSPFADANGADASGSYPGGTTVVTFTATDCCNLMSSTAVSVTVVDTFPPSFECNKIIVPMEDDLSIDVMPEDFLASIKDNCTDSLDMDYSFSGFDPDDDLRMYDCNQLGDDTLFVYAFDEAGNIDSCKTIITVTDPNNFCGNGFAADIGGIVLSASGEKVPGMELVLSGYMDRSVESDQDGAYRLSELPTHENYLLRGAFEGPWLQGVSAWDVVTIQRHLLGYAAFESAHQWIAADIDRSNTVTAADIVRLKKLMLGIHEEVVENTSWRFVDASYEFDDEPLRHSHFEEIEFRPLVADQLSTDFVAVKVGDVDESLTMSSWTDGSEIRSKEAVSLEYRRDEPSADGLAVWHIYAKEAMHLAALQLALRLDASAVQRIETTQLGPLVNGRDYTFWESDRILRLVWQDDQAHWVSASEPLLTLYVDMVDQELSMITEFGRFESAVFDAAGVDRPIVIESATSIHDIQAIELMGASPNPFSDITTIRFAVPEARTVEVALYDASSRVIWREERTYAKGLHSIVLDRERIGRPGIYYLKLRSADFEVVQKVLHIR